MPDSSAAPAAFNSWRHISAPPQKMEYLEEPKPTTAKGLLAKKVEFAERLRTHGTAWLGTCPMPCVEHITTSRRLLPRCSQKRALLDT
eukprot:scaffold4501_cov395-Prasinococcus_capsulatus_cf.AAC.11